MKTRTLIAIALPVAVPSTAGELTRRAELAEGKGHYAAAKTTKWAHA